MSVSRSAKCLFCGFSRAAASTGTRIPRRQFHLSAARLSDEESKRHNGNGIHPFPDRKTLEEMSRDVKPEDFKPYTEEEKEKLREVYTPEQMAAVEAGEESIDAKDLADQFAIRKDPMKFHYLDDFSVIRPGVDKHIREPESNTDYDARLKTEDEFMDDFGRFVKEHPDDPSGADFVRFTESLQVTKGKEENEKRPHSSLVPDLLAKGESMSGHRRYESLAGENPNASEEVPEDLRRLLLDTGYTKDSIQSLKTKVLVTRSVVNQTRMGKIRRSYKLAIAGNGNGLLGIGEAKSAEGPTAALQASYRAIRNMQPILRYEGRTIYGDVEGKTGAVELRLTTSPPGKFIDVRFAAFGRRGTNYN